MERTVLFTGVMLAMAIAVTTGEGPATPSDHIAPSHGTEEDDGDPYVASASTHKSRLIRNSHQLGEETFRGAFHSAAAEEESESALEGTQQFSGNSGGGADEAYQLSESNARPVRQRSGGRRRRPLDPERRRQLLLRRQKLGLPIRKFSREEKAERHQETQTDSSLTPDLMEDIAVLVATPGPKMVRVFPDVFTTTETPSTTPTTTSTTSRFPSFSAASRLRQRFKTIRDEWGLRTDVKEEEVIEPPSVKEPRNRVTSRARVVTASTRGINRNDKRLRYRPILVRKKLRSKVKVTSPAPTYPSDEPPVLEPVPVNYEEPEGADEVETQSYDSFSEEPSVQETFNTEPYYFSTEPSIYEPVTKPRHTPVPKKVALNLSTQRPKKHFQEPSAGVSDVGFLRTKSPFQPGERFEPKGLTPVPLGPELTPTTTPNYFSEVPHFTEPSRFPGLDQTSEPVFVPEPAYEVDPVYGGDPAYLPASDHTFDYSQQAAYAQEQFFAEEPIYDLNYDTSEEYSSEEYEDKPGIFDQYKYGYSVASEDTGNYHARSEARDGETVSGSYKVALPDGRVQIVTYVADDNGFRADVNYEGEAIDQSSDSPYAPPTTPRPSVSHPESHQRARPEEARPLFRQQVIPQEQFEEGRHDSHRVLQQQQAHRSRPSQPHSQSVRLVPRPVQQRPFEKPVTLVPDLEDDLTPTQAPRPINQNLRFHDSIHVTTPSPNPFRLVVEKSRASTFAPPVHSATISAFRNAMVLHNEGQFTTPTKRAPDLDAFTPSYEADEQHTTQPATTYSPIVATFKPLTDSHEHDNSLLSTTLPSSLKLRPAFSHNNFYRPSDTTPNPPVTESPKSETTNAHTMRPPHSPTNAPDTSGLYQYHSHNGHPREGETRLYNPDPNSAAYIHALGRTHAVPILLPVNRGSEHVPLHHRPRPPPIVTTSTPRTYYLNTPAVVLPSQHSSPIPPQLVRMIRVTPAPPLQYSSAEGVEIIRGDALRRRLTLKVPEPHETDIYPTPRPRIMIL